MASARRSSSPLVPVATTYRDSDIVNHCINDVLVQGARPLFFLDYFASSAVPAEQVAAVVGGMAAACALPDARCSAARLPRCPACTCPARSTSPARSSASSSATSSCRATIAPGDVLVGLLVPGPHTNGYSLLRRLFDWLPHRRRAGTASPARSATRCSRRTAATCACSSRRWRATVKALAHITGGGLIENLPRILPHVATQRSSSARGRCRRCSNSPSRPATASPRDELYRTLNMGIGMVVIVAPERVGELQDCIPMSRHGSSARSPSGSKRSEPRRDPPRVAVPRVRTGQQPAGDPRRAVRRLLATDVVAVVSDQTDVSALDAGRRPGVRRGRRSRSSPANPACRLRRSPRCVRHRTPTDSGGARRLDAGV